MHNLPNRERYLASLAYRASFTVPVATGVVRQSSFLVEPDLPGSIAIFADEAERAF
jgi:hypothetical protein